MLLSEYDYATDIAVQREEEREIALEEGAYQNKLETAKNLLNMNFPIITISKATGLSEEEIAKL